MEFSKKASGADYHNRRFSFSARSFAIVGNATVSMPESMLFIAVMLATMAISTTARTLDISP